MARPQLRLAAAAVTFLEPLLRFHAPACVCLTGVDFKIKTVELRGKKIRLQIW